MKPLTAKLVWMPAVLVLIFAPALAKGAPASKPVPGKFLWQIGKPDNDTREFALAPGGYAKFAEDAVFVVGHSDAKKDWPYTQPGPSDTWAGGRQHTFSVVFGLKAAPKDGQCRLVLDLVDTQGKSPPTLRIEINARRFDRPLPPGAGDLSISGQPDTGKEHVVSVPFPANVLTAGTNEVTITTLSGSWLLYDWLGLEAPAGLEITAPTGTVVRSLRSQPVLVKRDGKLMQTVQASLLHMGAPGEVEVQVGSAKPTKMSLRPGPNTVEAAVPAVEAETSVTVTVKAAGKTLATRQVLLAPVRKWVIYLLPHSHVDIGYTQVQTQVEQDHWRYYEQAIEAAKKTAAYPPGAQFKWNAEVLWATDSYLKQASPEKREAFLDALRKGWIGLDALYGNELTALCRPEELVRLTDLAVRLRKEYKIPIESAMISDVPGYTWGIVPVLAASGVKWFSIGPNGGHRIGYTLSTWGDKPFYWVGPAGRHKVLVWIPRTGYWRGFQGTDQLVGYLRQLEGTDYPFDLLQIRHCLGDNAGPGVDLCEFVKDWNTQYAFPKLVIATTREMFQDFERRYGTRLPEYRGDFTPYWEDGAGSSALETGLNRSSAERLVQAGALCAMLNPAAYRDADYYAAWRNVILYDEHTWGAHNSINQPDSDFAKAQWKIKQAFALDADKQSRALLAKALAPRTAAAGAGKVGAVDVLNTTSWPRTDLVVLDKALAAAGDAVQGPDGKAVPSQRLTTGELAFLAADVPALGCKRFTVAAGKAGQAGSAKADGATLANGTGLTVTVDPKTGAIASLRSGGAPSDLVDASKGLGLNDYFYVAGRDPKSPARSGPAKVTVKDPGPLVASLLIESDAPGCKKLTREVRVVAGLDRVDLINVVDKLKVRTPEGVHFGFAFRVPKGVIRMDTPWAVVRAEADQLPGACKNYFTVQRWTDVSNQDFGATWATVDAPLIEIGEITTDATAYRDRWIKFVLPTQTFYSYVMNNYWETNYKADQEGPTLLRYSIQPHGKYDPVVAQRFGVERSQPLIAVPAGPAAAAPAKSRLRVQPDGVIVTDLRPSRDGKALIVRLFNVSGANQAVKLEWSPPAPKAVYLSNFAEDETANLIGPVELSPLEFLTLRAVLP